MSRYKSQEFEELSNNIRHWEKMRWVSMTVFIAIMAVSLNAYFSKDITINNFNSYYLRLLGVAIVFIFWVLDERIVAYWKSFKERAHDIEKEIGIEVFSKTPKRGFFSAGTAVRVLYALFCAFWVAQLIL